MTIAATLEHCLQERQISYDVINHDRTFSCMESARTCHIPAERIAKSVIFEAEQHYLMAVVPASCQVSITHLNKLTRYRLSLASEQDGKKMFNDCEMGAYPPIGNAYGLETVVDDILLRQKDIYFETGDHTEMVHINGKYFQALLGKVKHGTIGRYRLDSHFGQQ